MKQKPLFLLYHTRTSQKANVLHGHPPPAYISIVLLLLYNKSEALKIKITSRQEGE